MSKKGQQQYNGSTAFRVRPVEYAIQCVHIVRTVMGGLELLY